MTIKAIEQRWPAVYQKTFGPLVALTILIIGLDAYVEYNETGFSSFVVKDLITAAICALVYLFYRLKWMSKSLVIGIMVYAIVLGIMLMLPDRPTDPTFVFEVYFLKVQIVIVILTYAIGILVHPRHVLVLLLMNLFFIGSCYYYTNHYIATEKYLFYVALITGAGVLGYKLHKIFIDLNVQVGKSADLIQQQNINLSRANLAKDELFEILGHDLKAPFFHLSALLALMEETDDPAKKAEYRSLMKQAISDGDELVVSLLNWVDVQSSYLKYDLQKFDLSAVVDDAVDAVSNAAILKEINVEKTIAAKPLVEMDIKVMETVLRNLINNAIKFSHRGSNVTVYVGTVDDFAVVEVRDTGVGMDKERKDKLFKVGKIEPTLGTENETGSGFGLNIVKKMVQNLNGKMEIESEVDKGTSVKLIFPLS